MEIDAENNIKGVLDQNHKIGINNVHSNEKETSNHKSRRKMRPWVKDVMRIVIFCVITAYTAWATAYFILNTDSLSWHSFNATTSRGYGLLVILYLIYIYTLIYYHLLKPYVLPNINKFLWKPGKEVLKVRTVSSVSLSTSNIGACPTPSTSTSTSNTEISSPFTSPTGSINFTPSTKPAADVFQTTGTLNLVPAPQHLWLGHPQQETLSPNNRYGSVIFYILVLCAIIAYLVYDTINDLRRLTPLLGICVFLLLGYLMSAQHKQVPWNTIARGMILQFAFGFLTIRWQIGRNVLATFSDHVNEFLEYGIKAAAFTYGSFLVNNQQVFAFNALSVIFFIGFVINLLYYYGLMQRFVNMLGECLQYIMSTSICESVNSVAVAFIGMSEGPMMLRPYLKYLTDSELHSMMLAGFASVSGSTFAAYISYGARAQDLITASLMSAPSALCFSKLLYPEIEDVRIKKKDVHMIKIEYSSAMDAASKGASDAFHLIAAIISGVTATLAFVYFINGVLTWLGVLVGFTDESNMWTLEIIAGKVFIPVAWIMGVEWKECEKVGQLIGVKTMVNEFVAFSRLEPMNLSPRSKLITTYAICGFSNPGSIGIMISTMAALVPEKQESVTRLVFRAFVGGAIVCCMTACIASILTTDEALDDITMDTVANSTIASS